MSARSDVSFPEPTSFNGSDNRGIGSTRGKGAGRVAKLVADRDKHDMWAALRLYRHQYGDSAMQELIDLVRQEQS